MGSQTGLMILNDAIGNLRDDKTAREFCDALLLNVNLFGHQGSADDGVINIPIGNHANGARMFHVAHADSPGVYAIGKNYTSKLAHPIFGLRSHAIHTPEAHLIMLRQIADPLGYELVSKRT